VVVTHVAPDSPAQQAGLTEGTFIRLVNDQPVQTPDAFYQEAQRASTSPVTLQLLDDRKVVLPNSKQ